MTCGHNDNECQNQTNTLVSPYKCRLCDQPEYKNGKGIACHVKAKHPEITFEDYYMKYMTPELLASVADKKIKNSSFPHEHRLTNVCLECKQSNCTFERFTRGFSIYCSEKCANKNSLANEIKQKNTEKALKEKYGVSNASQISGHGQRVRETKQQRYGDENYVNPEKIRQTMLERYGVKNYVQTDDYKQRVKEVSLEKYGVEHFTQAEEVKEKARITNLEKYGVEYAQQCPEIRKKAEETNLEKYGVKSHLCLEEIREKAKEATYEKYGCYHSLQNPSVLDKAKKSIRERYVTNFKTKNITEIIPVDFSNHTYKCVYCLDVFQATNVSLNERAKFDRALRCKKCFPIKDVKKYSIEEKEVFLYLQSLLPGVEIQNNVKGLLASNPRLELDIYIPSLNLAIEYNGLRWHGENLSKKKNSYHRDKTFNFWNEKKIRVIHVFSDDWKQYKDLVKSKLAHIVKANNLKKNILHARNLDLFLLNDKKSADKQMLEKVENFYAENHIQGNPHKSQTHILALSGEKIVASMSFSEQTSHIELERFCVDSNFIITGIASRLLKSYVAKMKKDGDSCKKDIVSFADICWTHLEENLYVKLGFSLDKTLPPRYWYFKPNTENKMHRFNFRKEKLAKKLVDYDDRLTEWQNMVNNNYDRVWDCGLLRYVYKV